MADTIDAQYTDSRLRELLFPKSQHYWLSGNRRHGGCLPVGARTFVAHQQDHLGAKSDG
jgi:hypothetical protein